MAVGVFTSSDATANVASTFLLVASMLYGGFLLSLSHMPPSMQLLSELSFVKHAFEVCVCVCMSRTKRFCLESVRFPRSRRNSDLLTRTA